MRRPENHDPDQGAADGGALLGEFLRARRDALRPHDLGLPAGVRRRAPGLRLSRVERGYLLQLAARADPEPPLSGDSAHPLSALVQAVRTPADVLDRRWDALAWNRPAASLFADWLGPHAHERNLLRYAFLNPRAREFIVDWSERSRRLVAEYRADTAAAREDPARDALVRELTEVSAEFSSAWRAQRVYGRDGGLRHFAHARRGLVAYEQYVMRLAENADLKMPVPVPTTPRIE